VSPSERAATRRARLKAAGKCVQGCGDPKRDDADTCRACSVYFNDENKRRRRAKKKLVIERLLHLKVRARTEASREALSIAVAVLRTSKVRVM
jgi:hypothetical protein